MPHGIITFPIRKPPKRSGAERKIMSSKITPISSQQPELQPKTHHRSPAVTEFLLEQRTKDVKDLVNALKGTLFLFEPHAVSRSDVEQINHCEALLARHGKG